MNNKMVGEWIEKAEHDYGAALVLHRKRVKPLHDIVCFHTQQCAEKYLKAFLTSADTPFAKTHDLSALLKEVLKKDGGFALIQDVLKILDVYSVEVRYPGDDPDRKEAERAVKAMKEIRTFVRGKLRGI
jgi:HEPN domain-containing protein